MLQPEALRPLVVSHALTSTAQTFGMVPVAVVLYAQTRSAAWVAAAAVAQYLPHLVLSGPAGVMADRHDRMRLLRWSSAGRAAAMVALAAAAALSAPPAAVVVLIATIAVLGTPAAPALMASVPDVVPPDRLVAANAALVGLDSMAFVAGPALGGALLIVASPASVLLAGAFLFLAGWRCLGGLHAPTGARDVAPAAAAAETAAGTVPRTAAVPFVFLVAINLIYGATAVLLVPVARELLATGSAGIGKLNAAIGVGSLAGLLLSSRVARWTTSLPLHTAALVGTGIPFALIALSEGIGSASVLLGLSSAASMVAEVLAITWLQRCAPAGAVGRTFGILEALAVAAMLAGSAVTPLVIRLAGLAGTLVVAGVAVPLLALAVAVSLPVTKTTKELV
nr:major facilitator transporter [uncultured bacterium]